MPTTADKDFTRIPKATQTRVVRDSGSRIHHPFMNIEAVQAYTAASAIEEISISPRAARGTEEHVNRAEAAKNSQS